MDPRAFILVHEGPDGSGKETQTTLLCERLTREGMPFHRVDFPTYGEDPAADCIRFMLRERKEEWNLRSWESKALLYAANRHRFFAVHAEVLREPRVLVCNRYVPSNQAHMAAYVDDETEWHRRIEWIAHLEYDILGLPRPDIAVLHTMPIARSTALLDAREHGKRDAHEADTMYLARVERCYQFLAAREPETWAHVPADVDGMVENPRAIHERVWHTLTNHTVWRLAVAAHAAAASPRSAA